MAKTTDFLYNLPLRARIKIYSQGGDTLYFTFDSFSGSNPFKVVYVDAEDAAGESGTFNIIIEDSQNAIDESLLRNTEVHIEFGKTNSYTNGYYMIGPARIFRTNRPRTGYQDYLLSGFGDWIKAAELLLLIRQASRISDLDDSNPALDGDYNIDKQMKDMVNKRKWRPLNREDIQSITNWSTSGISNKLQINNPVINEVFSTVWDFSERNSAIIGAPVFLDYSQGTKILTMKPFPDLHSGIVVKSADVRHALDDPKRVSYIKDAIAVEDNASIEAGIATRLYTSTIVDRQVVAKQTTADGALPLDFQAVAQQVSITNDSRRLDSIEFQLSKVGEPTSPNDRVNGDIVLDSGNTPTGNVLDTFSIPLSSLKKSKEKIEVELDIKSSKLEGGSKFWFRFFQRSGLTGNPTHDPKNTVLVHHNNIFNTAQTLYSATAPNGDRETKDKLVWKPTNQGPMFYFKLRSNIKRMQARTNATAQQLIGTIERYIDTSFMKDPRIVDRFLALVLNQTSKPRRTIPDLRVTNPNDFLFRKFQGVTFIDGLSGIEQDLQVLRSRYVISALPGEHQVGTFHCDITLGGTFNSLLASCGCT